MTLHRLLLLALALGLSPLARAAEPPLHLFLLIGQSNMAGRAAIEEADKEPIEGALLWDIKKKAWLPAVPPYNLHSPHAKGAGMQKLNPGPSFVREYLKANPGVRVGIVCAARGGTNIKEWKGGQEKPQPLYATAVAAAKAALASEEKPVLKGILWHQGESNSSKSEEYPKLLAELVENLRKDLAEGKPVPFVFAQIGSWRESYEPFNKMITKQPAKIEASACVTTEGLGAQDSAHFDTEGQRGLGERYAKEMLKLLKR